MTQKKECGQKTAVFSRVNGYYRPVSNWNKGKQSEYAERKEYENGKERVCAAGC